MVDATCVAFFNSLTKKGLKLLNILSTMITFRLISLNLAKKVDFKKDHRIHISRCTK
jgi:hypothetical protein